MLSLTVDSSRPQLSTAYACLATRAIKSIYFEYLESNPTLNKKLTLGTFVHAGLAIHLCAIVSNNAQLHFTTCHQLFQFYRQLQQKQLLLFTQLSLFLFLVFCFVSISQFIQFFLYKISLHFLFFLLFTIGLIFIVQLICLLSLSISCLAFVFILYHTITSHTHTLSQPNSVPRVQH